jgi:diguanylate cyclase (GGDEF)-like protein
MLQMVLAELELQKEIKAPRPEPVGGPVGSAAASNNLGAAYSTMKMFELALPHLQRAARLSEDLYGPQLRLQVIIDYANLAEAGVHWALHAESVGRTNEARQRAQLARRHAREFGVAARQQGRSDAERFARVLLIGARSVAAPEEIHDKDRIDLEEIRSFPIFGDDPAAVVVWAVTARVCRLTGDPQGCREAAMAASHLHHTGDHTMISAALREAALIERPEEFTWAYARAIAGQTESARRRAVAAFRTRLALAGLEQRYERISADRQRLQRQLEEAARGEAELIHAATHDALTGLANRTLFMQRLETVMQSCRVQPTDVAVAFIDLDNLKAINDDHGHALGDQVLRWVADQLQASVGAGDTVARISGDEFAVLLVSHEELATVGQWADRINDDLNDLRAQTQAPKPVTVSVGVCLVPAGSQATSEQVLEVADRQMYAAKQAGKARARLLRLDQ